MTFERAVTVGLRMVLDAREIVVIVTGASKARALQHIVEKGVNTQWTASVLQISIEM